MKVLLIYGAYGREHEETLARNVRRYADYSKYQFRTIVMATERLRVWTPGGVEFRFFNPELKMEFLWKHQDVIKEFEKEDFDLLVFAEDDALITENNLDYFVEHQQRLSDTAHYPGFISYEKWETGCYLHSMDYRSWAAGMPFEVDGVRYWSVTPRNRMMPNPHQCCFVFDRKTFDKLVSEKKFYVQPELVEYRKGKFLGARESATNWMWKYYFRKAWAVDDLRRGMLLHDDHWRAYPVGPEVKEFIHEVSS
jgi:hypothetical protein